MAFIAHLEQADKYHKKASKKLIIIALGLVAVSLVFVLIINGKRKK